MAIHEDTVFLDQAMRSVLEQTFRDFEFLIVANGATDELWRKLNGYIDDRIRLIRTRLRGLAFALNVGISEAQGVYVGRMDADDLVHPNKLALQVDFLDRNPDVGLVGTWASLIDEHGHLLKRRAARFSGNREIRRVLPYRNPLIHASVLFRRDVLVEAKGYLHGHMSEDHEMFIRMARRRDLQFANIPEPLYLYRKYPGQATSVEWAREAYFGISSFLFAEFLRTKNPKYLLGIAVVHPWRRMLSAMSHRRSGAPS